MSEPVGWERHRQGVARLVGSYHAVPPGAPVRLRTTSSNLFRDRVRTEERLDATGLTGVIEVDVTGRSAEVQGMCTYEHLLDVTLVRGLMPLVVPQLRTITLGGAVAGLGIEATSFRNGLPHESVREMDVLTGSGDVVTTRPGEDLFDTFPNSYGSLGYAVRLRIDLEPAPDLVSLRHVHHDDAARLAACVAEIEATRHLDGVRVDGLDGVSFGPGHHVLTVATWRKADTPGESTAGANRPSDYTREQVYYRSVEERETDLLTGRDYLWRWDTDWFWCSRAFGAQHPVVRRVWPRRWRRSDVYLRLLALDRRFSVADRLDRRAGRPQRERVVQDVEVPVDRLAEFLAWFDETVGLRPVWLCPVRATRRWPTYPLDPAVLYVNVGFWGTVHVGPDAAQAPLNRAVEAEVHSLGGHKSLYSEAFYDRETFDTLYAGPHLAAVKRRFDPEDRLTSLYEKVVRRA